MLKAGNGSGSERAAVEEDREASPSWSVLREAERWDGGERDGGRGEEGPEGGTEGRDVHELWEGDEQTTCVFGAEEGLEGGARFDMAGTATSEEPETHQTPLVYLVTLVNHTSMSNVM